MEQSIEEDVKRPRQNVNVLEKELNGGVGKKKRQQLLQLQERYKMRRKG